MRPIPILFTNEKEDQAGNIISWNEFLELGDDTTP